LLAAIGGRKDIMNWVQDGLRLETKRLREVEKAYESLKDKRTTYAKKIFEIVTIRKELVDIWRRHANGG
jgi:hypothetical protein